MKILMLLACALCTTATAVSAAPAHAPPAAAQSTEVDGHFEQALAGLHALHEENLRLRERLRQIEERELPTVTVPAGTAVHVRIDEFTELPADERQTHLMEILWDFGDDAADFDDLGGFNAAHLYETPGTYAISLNGRPVKRVVVTEDQRPRRVVASAAQLATAARAGGAIVQLPPGETAIAQTITLGPGTLLVGDPAGSALVWSGATGGVMLAAPTGNVTIRNVSFDTAPASGGAGFEKTAAEVLRASGSDIAMVGCTLLNVSYGINGNGRPARVLVQSCAAPLETGLRAYLAWVEGEQWVFLGNRATNSTREHIIRCGAGGPQSQGTSFILVAYNDLHNIDRRQAAENPDARDTAKGALMLQVGRFGWAEHNLLRGVSAVGPLGDGDGLKDPSRRFRHAVLRDNRHLETLHVEHGAEHVLIARSRFELPPSGGDGGACVKIEPFDARYGRGVIDVTLRDCELISPYRDARMLWVQGAVAGRLELAGNTFIVGDSSFRWPTVPLVFEGGWQAGTYASRENLYPPAPGVWPDKQAVARLGAQNDVTGYVTPPRWLALPGVIGDRFSKPAVEETQ